MNINDCFDCETMCTQKNKIRDSFGLPFLPTQHVGIKRIEFSYQNVLVVVVLLK